MTSKKNNGNNFDKFKRILTGWQNSNSLSKSNQTNLIWAHPNQSFSADRSWKISNGSWDFFSKYKNNFIDGLIKDYLARNNFKPKYNNFCWNAEEKKGSMDLGTLLCNNAKIIGRGQKWVAELVGFRNAVLNQAPLCLVKVTCRSWQFFPPSSCSFPNPYWVDGKKKGKIFLKFSTITFFSNVQ